MRCGVILLRYEVRGEITKYYFYQTLSMFIFGHQAQDLISSNKVKVRTIFASGALRAE